MASTWNYYDASPEEQTYRAENFQPNLERLMEKMNLTQADVAKKCGLTQPMVYNWLSEKSEPSLYSLARLFQGLGVDPNWLMAKHEILK